MLNMRQILPLLIFCCCNIGCLVAQELNAAVTVNSSRIGGDRQLFDRLEQQLGSFINERKWMEEQGAADEKIDCSFTLLIHEMPSPSSFKCELLVQARRPVAGTTRKTTLLNYRESSLLFDYTDFQPLEFNPDHITSNLVATIAFYANLIIGLHSDSMTPLGGSASFRQMMAIANNVQFNHWSGWDMDDRGRNRYAIAALFNDPAFEDYRTMWYGYHREGLDEIAINSEKGRQKVVTSLSVIASLHKRRSGILPVSLFGTAKLDELVDVLAGMPQQEKLAACDMLQETYPAQRPVWERLLRTNR
jgi:hypothetical protein